MMTHATATLFEKKEIIYSLLLLYRIRGIGFIKMLSNQCDTFFFKQTDSSIIGTLPLRLGHRPLKRGCANENHYASCVINFSEN